MLASLLLLVLAISGGLFAGTILHSASQITKFDQIIDLYQSFWG
jgi:hypothetical protein